MSYLTSAYVNIQDQKTQNTAGGTFTSGAWQTRTLNTKASDTGNNASLASNQITLAPGTYRCRIVAPGFGCGRHQARLQNITGSTTIALGSSQFADTTNQAAPTQSLIVARFTIASSTVLEVQHHCETTKTTNGFGVESNFGTEVYTIVELWRE